ncbi:MAG TPA: HEPN domain-containing protein [Vicinamibacterales bacterium]|nr:HEPN domain-containing protein [Vicinamibacterales bacterium]
MRRAPRIARVLLRLPADLHKTLVKAAADAGLSFNEFCVRRLRAPADVHGFSAVRSDVVSRARAVFGDQLAGVLVLGSWARGEAAATSDIDVLIVVDSHTALTRDLYREWDAVPLSFEGRSIDAHFVHPSAAGAVPTAVWCEAAVDGIVWYDRDGAMARRLGDVRRASPQADVVRESQEIVELTLKGLLRASGVEPPRIHDVADVLLAERDRLPKDLAPHVDRLADISRALRRDRELAFYGAEDLTPSAFYRESDAVIARDGARDAVASVRPHVAGA